MANEAASCAVLKEVSVLPLPVVCQIYPPASIVPVFPVVDRHFNPVQNTLCRHDLIRTHHKQHIFGSKNTISGQNIQNGMSGKESLCKVHKIGNRPVITVSPIGSKLKTVGGFPAALFPVPSFSLI